RGVRCRSVPVSLPESTRTEGPSVNGGGRVDLLLVLTGQPLARMDRLDPLRPGTAGEEAVEVFLCHVGGERLNPSPHHTLVLPLFHVPPTGLEPVTPGLGSRCSIR